MDKNSEIKKVADALHEEIMELKRKLDDRQALLDVLGEVCTHSTIEMYRGHQVGTCEFCYHQFMTRGNIDAIFSN